jgi:hypothetical protein
MAKLNGGVVFGSANSVTARKDYALLLFNQPSST